MYFRLYSNVFTNLLKIYELPKIYNKILEKLLTIISGQFYVTISSGFWTSLKMYICWQKTLLALNQKKYPRQDIFKKCSAKRVFLFCCIIYCPYFLQKNLAYVLEINIFGRDEISQIWIISSKDINIQCLYRICYRELRQYLIHFDALEKSEMRLRITVFKNCNIWTPVYKDYWKQKVYILKKCSYSNWKQI